MAEEQFFISAGAYVDARSVASKLKSICIPYFTEAIRTKQGDVTRLRAGPFKSSQEAELALVRLEALGLRPGSVAVATEPILKRKIVYPTSAEQAVCDAEAKKQRPQIARQQQSVPKQHTDSSDALIVLTTVGYLTGAADSCKVAAAESNALSDGMALAISKGRYGDQAQAHTLLNNARQRGIADGAAKKVNCAKVSESVREQVRLLMGK